MDLSPGPCDGYGLVDGRGPVVVTGRAADGRGVGSGVGLGQLRPVGREPFPDVPQPREVMHVTGQRGHFGHGHFGVTRGEAVTGALLAGEQLHALGVQPQQICGELFDGPVGDGPVGVRGGGGAFGGTVGSLGAFGS